MKVLHVVYRGKKILLKLNDVIKKVYVRLTTLFIPSPIGKVSGTTLKIESTHVSIHENTLKFK